jgi:hypothetical protein
MKLKNRLCMLAGMLALWGLAGGGCQSITLADITGAKYEEYSIVERNKQDTFLAVRRSLEDMHFEHLRGSPAQSFLEMAARVMPGTEAELTRQRTAHVEFTKISEFETGVSIGFWEYDEETSASGISTTAGRRMRAGIVYEAFWDHMDAELALLPPVVKPEPEGSTRP